MFLYNGLYLAYALIVSRHIRDRPIVWELAMFLTNTVFGVFGTGMFIFNKYTFGGELLSTLASTFLPWAQVSNAGAAIVNAFFLYLSYETPESNPFSDPRYFKIFITNEVTDILGLIWGIRAFYKQKKLDIPFL